MPSFQELAQATRIYNKDTFVSIWDVQKSPSTALKSENWFKIILKNSKPAFVVFDYEEYEDMLEDNYAMHDEKYLKKIKESRESWRISSNEVYRKLWI